MGEPKVKIHQKDKNNLEVKGDLENEGVDDIEVRCDLEYMMEEKGNLKIKMMTIMGSREW